MRDGVSPQSLGEIQFITTDKAKASRGGEKVSVGVMKNKEPKLEEIEAYHTLGGAVIHTSSFSRT